ncbi:MAG TPA: cupin domain-containing protein [Planctomycetota bacterium]|nr:cupin domain-containing protein [Planctomycetota bacterium]
MTRDQEFLRSLRLAPHPEGGHYREIWRSPAPPGVRAASTLIYYLLEAGQHSRWHRVDADEIWTWLEGAPLELWTWTEGQDPERHLLGRLDAPGIEPVCVVPAGCWQAARPVDGFVLSACAVAPGFDFRGFSLLADRPKAAERLRRRSPGSALLI